MISCLLPPYLSALVDVVSVLEAEVAQVLRRGNGGTVHGEAALRSRCNTQLR